MSPVARAFRAGLFFCSLALIPAGCATESGGPPEPSAPPPAGTGLEEARAWLEKEVRSPELDVAFEGPFLELAPPCVLDIEFGSGHGGSLTFVRLEFGATTTACERVSWQAYRRNPEQVPGRAHRADVATTTMAPLLDLVRALSAVRVTEKSTDQLRTSSADFFVLVRVMAPEGAEIRTWEYAGYPGTRNQVTYAAPQAVVNRARELLESVAWAPVPVPDLRKTHFPDAFERNRDIYAKKFHWWVTERSIEALGWFGNRSAIPTVEWIRDHVPGLIERQQLKIRHILDEPELYLEGPHREMPE